MIYLKEFKIYDATLITKKLEFIHKKVRTLDIIKKLLPISSKK